MRNDRVMQGDPRSVQEDADQAKQPPQPQAAPAAPAAKADPAPLPRRPHVMGTSVVPATPAQQREHAADKSAGDKKPDHPEGKEPPKP